MSLKCTACEKFNTKKFSKCRSEALETGASMCTYGAGPSILKWTIRLMLGAIPIYATIWSISAYLHGGPKAQQIAAIYLATESVLSLLAMTALFVEWLRNMRVKHGFKLFGDEYYCAHDITVCVYRPVEDSVLPVKGYRSACIQCTCRRKQ